MRCSAITVLANKNNIVIRIKEGTTISEVKKDLKEILPELKKFYKEEKNPILITGKTLKDAEMDVIQKMITKVLNVSIEFDIPRGLGLHKIKRIYSKDIATSETKFYRQSIRSGQRIEFEGSIVIIGDVNDGAEVIAEDNIIVLGNLRGMAHAGARGNKNAIIAAHVIDSAQLRIASIIRERSRDEIESQFYSYAYVSDREIIELES